MKLVSNYLSMHLKKALQYRLTFFLTFLSQIMLIGSVIIYVSLFIIGAAFCFVTIQGLEFLNIFTNGSRQVGQYPMGIYKKVIKIIFTYIIPLTLINYYPINYLNGKITNVAYIFIPILTIVILIISILIFNKGVSKYCSTGS